MRTLAPSAALLAALVPAALSAQVVPNGSFTTTGQGCPAPVGGALYELFSGTGTGDLAGLSVMFTPTGDGWTIQSGGSFEAAFTGTDLGLVDDQLANVALPFGFPFPGVGTLTTLDIDSNGRAGRLQGSDFSQTVDELLNGSDVILAPWWDDLDPLPGSSVHTTAFTGGPLGSNRFVVTWDRVQQYPLVGDQNTFQIQLFDDGSMVWSWQTGCADNALVGLSTGGGVPDPGATDWSTALPLTFTGLGGRPLSLMAQPGTLPVIGQTFGIETHEIPSGATFGAFNLAFLPLEVSLAPIGAPGCFNLTFSDLQLPLTLNGTAPALSTVSIPNIPSIAGGTLFTQALVAVPGINRLGVISSDRGEILIGRRCGVVMEAVGANSFNADTQSGFWRIANNSGQQITAVTLDWSTTPDQDQLPRAFDTDQISMGDRFDGGNSQTPGCLGTYRNACDVLTGLDYAGSMASACDPAALTGFVGSNPGSAPGEFQTLDFAFTDFDSGELFEFDCDTDRGVGINGAEMRGLVVTVTLADGCAVRGVLRENGAQTSRVEL